MTLAGPGTTRYRENGDGYVESEYSVSGSDADITWSLSGADGSLFSLGSWNSLRSLRFNSPPNYEDPEDADGDNEYRLTIEASDGTNSVSLQVVVVVTNAGLDSDEVPVITGTPQVGETLTADVSRISPPNEFSERAPTLYFWIRTDGTTDTYGLMERKTPLIR